MKKARITTKPFYVKETRLSLLWHKTIRLKKTQSKCYANINIFFKRSLITISPYISWYIYEHFSFKDAKIIMVNIKKAGKYIFE